MIIQKLPGPVPVSGVVIDPVNAPATSRDLQIGSQPSLQSWFLGAGSWLASVPAWGTVWRDRVSARDMLSVGPGGAPAQTISHGFQGVQFLGGQRLAPTHPNLSLNLSEWTVSLIFVSGAAASILGRVNGAFDGGSDGQLILTTGAGTINANYHRSGSFVSGAAVSGVSTINDGNLKLVTVSYNSSDGIRVSINGTLETVTGSFPTLTDGRFCIGGDYNSSLFQGVIYEVKAFNIDLHRPGNSPILTMLESNDRSTYGI